MRKSLAESQTWLPRSLPTVVYSFLVDQNYTENTTLHSNGSVFDKGFNRTATDPLSRANCIPPSIEEFPEDFFSHGQRLRGGFLVHALVVVYVCAMLAIVCDRYFVPSLRVICKYFNVPADIAGATFMAIGTSSPELFSSVIGAFVAKGDIGVGTVVGSAVFNILGVTGVSGLAIGVMSVHLEWYPITRDCFTYIVTVSTLVIVIHDNVVTWVEATCLLSMFLGYLLILYFNEPLKRQCTKMLKSLQSSGCCGGDQKKTLGITSTDESILLSNSYKHQPKYHSYDDSACPSSSETSLEITDSGESDTLANERMASSQSKSDEHSTYIVISQDSKSQTESLKLKRKHCGDYEEFEGSIEFSLLSTPPTLFGKILWLVMWPANLIFSITIPNCNTPENLKWFPITFLSSILWLGMLSYISFWMVAIIGYTFGIPDTVSGLTILAAGTSVPELVASVIVVKNGLANMAISNLIGSNIFDILFCLGLPWLVKALLNTETYSVVINSSALTYTTLILLSTVVLFYLSLVGFRWRYGWRVGVVALCLYATFLVLASLYESNVFGDYNPPTCPRPS